MALIRLIRFRRLVKKLAVKSDVIIENFKPGSKYH